MASAREWEELPPAVSERGLLPAAVESVLPPAVSERERELLPAAVQSVLAPVAIPEYLGARMVAARGNPLALCPCIGE